MSVSIHHLRASVAAWLRYRRRCPVVALERGLSFLQDRPDVIGVTAARYLIEVEIKMSAADFRAEKYKYKWSCSTHSWRQFYYCMPPELAEKLAPKIPEITGLMTISDTLIRGAPYKIKVLRRAPVNREGGKRLTARQLLGMSYAQSGTICGLLRDVAPRQT